MLIFCILGMKEDTRLALFHADDDAIQSNISAIQMGEHDGVNAWSQFAELQRFW